jgi:uncharacterized protein (UPF0548 family)
MSDSVLYQLNKAADNLQDGLSPADLSVSVGKGRQSREISVSDIEEWNHHLQLVLDIMAKAPVLVVSLEYFIYLFIIIMIILDAILRFY